MDRNIIKKVLKYIKKYYFLVILSLVMAMLQVAAALYIPVLVGRGLDCIIGQGQVDYDGLFSLLKKGIVVILSGGAAQWLMNTINNRITYNVIRDIRKDAFNQIERLPLAYLDENPTGDLLSRCIADVDQFADGLLMGFTQFFTGVMTILGTLIFMLRLDLGITLIVVVLTPVSFLVARFIAAKTHDMFKEQSAIRGKQTAMIDEVLGNQQVVKAYSQEKQVLERFDSVNEKLGECSKKATFYSSLTNPCTRFVNSLVYAGVAVFGAFSALKGLISVGEMTTFLSYANQYTKPFNEISGVVTELQNAMVCAGRVFELIEAETEVDDVFSGSENMAELGQISGRVSLENVGFSYNENKPLIQNFNLQVKPGMRVAIVGPTGCGKTTLINLLMRFYDVNSGKISVEEKDIRRVKRHSLRLAYGMVLQDTWIRSKSVLDNIRLGRPEASLEEVMAAAKSTSAHSFIKRLPKGYDTILSENGAGLSVGQKQLLCITRVMLCLPPMLILDEATSSIDTRTEQKIQKAFAAMMKGRTSFIVAHRLSTIMNADIILVMKDGNIIEQGNHETLLAKKGFYASLYNSQWAGC